MLECSSNAEERFQFLLDLKKQIEIKEELIKNLELKGGDFCNSSQDYFKYSSKIIVLTGISLLTMISLLMALFLLADKGLILAWNNFSLIVTFVFACLIIGVLIYSQKQNTNLQRIARLNDSAFNWFDDIVRLNDKDIQNLKDKFCTLALNQSYLTNFDDTQLETIDCQLRLYSSEKSE